MEETFNSGDTAWILCSTAFVLLMTLPGLALFYGGMVKGKNILACLMQKLSIACLITLLWMCFGYSLAFAPTGPDFSSYYTNPFCGDASRFWLLGVTAESRNYIAPRVPEALYCIYQLTFAIIAASLICGSFADRMKYGSMLLFMTCWHLFVYCPIAYWSWHPNGFLYKAGNQFLQSSKFASMEDLFKRKNTRGS